MQTTTLIYAGLAIREHGRPNDGLTLFQVGSLKAREIPRDEQRAVVIGELGRAAVEARAGGDRERPGRSRGSGLR